MVDTDRLLEDLTAEQREAATHVDGPLLIIAGAGSGKTRVITRRVAYLIGQGIEPWSILAITFTNKAAGEMKSRVSAVLDRPVRDFGKLDQRWPTICTFHSLCLRILRYYAGKVGLPPNFTIYDSSDQTKLVKDSLKALDISSTNFSPGTIHSTISNAKNHLIDAPAFASNSGDFYQRTVSRVYTKYQQLLDQNGALDFDDLLMKTCFALREHQDVLHELQERFRYILIDEYQDTNHAQYILAHALAQKHRNICVVGDPDQSIYAWRGADLRNILDFETDYADAKTVKLERNYRSTKNILAIASRLIEHNSQRKKKDLWSDNEAGDKAKVFICQDEDDEARTVAQQLKDLHETQHIDWGRMAIFYRMNSLSRPIEDAMRMAEVPYVMARGVAFYERREVKDVLAYLRVIANPADEVSLTRIVNVPARGLGDTTIKQLQVQATARGLSLWGALQQADKVHGLTTRAQNSAKAFVELVQTWRRLAASTDAAPQPEPEDIFSQASVRGRVQTIMEDVVRRSGIEAMLRKSEKAHETAADDDPMGNVNGLITEAAKYDAEFPDGTLDDFLAGVTLRSDVDALKDGSGAVTLMTLHAAKGLEFPVVAMIGMEEGCLPHARARGNLLELEEERRLCFVGITRAQERLIFTKAAYRTTRGLRERTVTSPFLGEMPRELLDVTDRTELSWNNGQAAGAHDQRYDPVPPAGQFQKGQLVRHPRFGLGRIAEMLDLGKKAIVDFNTEGRKTLILEYARLEKVG